MLKLSITEQASGNDSCSCIRIKAATTAAAAKSGLDR
jgi:hypothetical protein